MKILVVDIETRPSMAYVWRLWDENVGIDQIVKSGEMISWAAKWHGEKEVLFASTFHDGRKKMVKGIWALLNEADAVVHWKGRTFDVPHINAEFIKDGLTPPAPFHQIDLYESAKREFNFVSNRLNYVAQLFDLGTKLEHEGFGLWVKCMANDPTAWERMKKYNIQDTVLTDKLYDILLPWIQRHPSHGAKEGIENVCPQCGSTSLQRRGEAFTKTGSYARYRCNKCGKWSRATKRMSKTNIVEIGR